MIFGRDPLTTPGPLIRRYGIGDGPDAISTVCGMGELSSASVASAACARAAARADAAAFALGAIGVLVLGAAHGGYFPAAWGWAVVAFVAILVWSLHRAASWLPWSTQPWQQLGGAQLVQGQTGAAQASFKTAIGKDTGDWSLWLDVARASTRKTQLAALAHAARLNPLSPGIATFRSKLGSQSGISITASGAKP